MNSSKLAFYRFFAIFFLLQITNHFSFAQSVKAAEGILDATTWNFANGRLALSGQWHFYKNQLISPESIPADTPETVSFPLVWNDESFGGQAINFGTYSLDIIVKDSIQTFGLELPQMYSSYRLWINGKEIAHNGTVGKNAKETQPQWLPQTIAFTTHGNILHVILQISNFYHVKGGSKDPIYLGTSEQMEAGRTMAAGSSLAEAITLTLTGLIFLVVWQLERKKVILYFTLICITWALRSLFSNLYLGVSFYPAIDWSLVVKIEYITLYLTMIWAILFLNRLFPLESNLIVKYLLVGVNILFLVVTLFSAPVFFTRLLPVYLGFCAFLLGYGLYIILRAWVNDHAGVWYLIISILMGIGIFAYDFFSYQGVFSYHPLVFAIGYVTIFLLMAVSLLFHLNIIKSRPSTAILTYKELYQDNSK